MRYLLTALTCLSACAVQAAAVAAPPLPREQVDDGVGLTDAPLKSLYPEVPVLPKVRLLYSRYPASLPAKHNLHLLMPAV